MLMYALPCPVAVFGRGCHVGPLKLACSVYAITGTLSVNLKKKRLLQPLVY